MARRSVRLLASIAAVATMVTTFAACGNKQATTDENVKPIVNILVRRNVTDHPMQDTQYTKDLDNVRIPAHFRFCSSLRC